MSAGSFWSWTVVKLVKTPKKAKKDISNLSKSPNWDFLLFLEIFEDFKFQVFDPGFRAS